MAWQHSRQKLSPVKICVSMVTRLYRCFVYVMQNRAICVLPLILIGTARFCAVLATVFVASVTRPSLGNY